MSVAGFFGKLPSHGDFVSRRLSREFLDVWDNWLQRSIAESKAMLGSGWLDTYLTSPIWRFAAMPGICGESGVLGLIMPSIDRVGRYFPLTIAAPIPDGRSALGSAIAAAPWFEASEQLLLSVLSDDAPGLDEFDRYVELSSEQLADLASLPLPRSDGTSPDARLWQLHADEGSSAGLAICSLAGGVILEVLGPISVWWSGDTASASADFRATRGLPAPGRFADMLGSRVPAADRESIPEDWQDSLGIPRSVAAEPTPGVSHRPEAPTDLPPVPSLHQIGSGAAASTDTMSIEALINSPVELDLVSAARSVVGKVRRDNEDAVLEQSDRALWVVADGMGGHAAGKTASSAIVTAMEDADLPTDIDARVEVVSRILQSVNGQLRAFAERRQDCAGLGSTVAVLTVAAGTCAIVWAGDTRVYRKRGQQLEQLTIDHSQHQERLERGDINSILADDKNVVTRAVGGDRILQVSTVRQTVHAGDRYLLCSDGVYDELPSFQLAELLDERSCDEACEAIIAAVLEGRAPDNASAIVVEANSR